MSAALESLFFAKLREPIHSDCDMGNFVNEDAVQNARRNYISGAFKPCDWSQG